MDAVLGLSRRSTAHWTIEGEVYSDAPVIREKLSRGVYTLSWSGLMTDTHKCCRERPRSQRQTWTPSWTPPVRSIQPSASHHLLNEDLENLSGDHGCACVESI